MKKPTPGKFIVFEGLDGAGTSTQMALLKNWLSQQDIFAEVTKEPSNGPAGVVIRQAIEERIVMTPTAIALAFACDRVDHLQNDANGVQKSLGQGSWVLCDRYVLSSLAYQSSEGMDLEWLKAINRFAFAPHVTIFVDTSIEVCVERINRRSSHNELFHHSDKLKTVRTQYQQLLDHSELTGHLVKVNGDGTEQEVFAELITQFQQWMEQSTAS